MKLVSQVKLNIGYTKADIYNYLQKNYRLTKNEILSLEIVKESIDSRKKPNIYYSLNVAIEVEKKSKYKVKNLKDYVLDKQGLTYQKLENINFKRPIIVGFGPSGMFAGLVLALSGLNPIIVEQGKNVDDRKVDIENFWNNRELNENSNVQFGEGGAGTFSDGKLNSNLDNIYCKKVINEFVINGAPKEIFYKSKPHIGSDKLPIVVKNIREKIKSLGGEVLFNTQFIDMKIENKKIKSATIKNVISNEKMEIETDTLLLCIGHSAIKTFELLKQKEFFLEQKPFAMGVRIEHLQEEINLMQYGMINPNLPSADYKLVEHLDNGRSVFTFCMCPGGYVVSSGSEKEMLVTNGMSYFARDNTNANSALLVNVLPEDFPSKDSLSGLYFQREYEHKAFLLGGKDYSAPFETVGSFLETNKEVIPIKSSYMPSLKFANIKDCLPEFVTQSLKQAIKRFQIRYKHFINDDNLLIGIETRSSSPVKITRNEDYSSKNYEGIFPVGEGAGYAGGIMSSCQDGIKVAEKVVEYIKNLKI
ncbi:MAG: hypothetical protein IJW82_02110 [Clostridia bacterium]|nr:hypothetical protein [Clostridia bacterium]